MLGLVTGSYTNLLRGQLASVPSDRRGPCFADLVAYGLVLSPSVSQSPPPHPYTHAGRRTTHSSCMERYCTMTVTMDHLPHDLTGPSWHDHSAERCVRCAKPRPRTFVSEPFLNIPSPYISFDPRQPPLASRFTLLPPHRRSVFLYLFCYTFFSSKGNFRDSLYKRQTSGNLFQGISFRRQEYWFDVS